MNGPGVIDTFLGTFTQYIDSGFGLVSADVHWLAGILIAMDITLAGLFWAMAREEDVTARLIRKTLYIGLFAYIIGNFNTLAGIVFNSFAGLGLKAGGGTLTQSQLLQPGQLAQVGINAGKPILTTISGMMGFTSFFANFVQIAVLFVAWLIVILSFFVIAIQLFVTLIEFKLTTLAGFVLVPFALFGRTAFLAERVLGNVVASGIKILVLAVIIGIGSTIFGQFTTGLDNPATINDALSLILASLTLLGIAIFGPALANGLIAGGPQLGAGAAATTGLGAMGLGLASTSALAGASRALVGTVSQTAHGAAQLAGGASHAYRSGGLAGLARAGVGAAASPLKQAASGLADSYAKAGQNRAPEAASSSSPPSSSTDMPAWARQERERQKISRGVADATSSLRSGDRGASGHSIDLNQGD